MRRLLKFLHTVGAAGLMGSAAGLAIFLIVTAQSTGDAGYVPDVHAMSKVAAWVVGPSMALTIISGLLAMAATPTFHDAGWVWAKAATGILILEGSLHVLGPLQEEAKRASGALAGGEGAASATLLFQAEINTLWLLLAVSIANTALGVWRPRFPSYRVRD
ncbi:MAG: DUF2269 family protein [Alphaproteobacteria bacterium]|nr:DUF2269 family protein [Alphaproteobacteria bacterium]